MELLRGIGLGMRWAAIEPGAQKTAHGGSGTLRVLVLPARELYFERVETPFHLSNGDPGAMAYIAGALDAALPLPVEDCLAFAAPEDGGRACAAFAIERRAYGRLADGAPHDAVLPAPLAAWHGAILAASGIKADGWLVHMQADAGCWTVIAGRCLGNGAFTSPESMATVDSGDRAGAARMARILAAKGSGKCFITHGGGAESGEVISAALPGATAACGADGIGETPALAERYASERLVTKDLSPAEAESPAVRRMRSRRGILAPAAFAALFSILALASAWLDISARANLRRSDAALGLLADALAGYPQGLAGRAALAPAANAFAQRIDPHVALFAEQSPSPPLRILFSFANARSLGISSIEKDGGTLSAELHGASAADAEALVAAMARSGYQAQATPDVETRPGGTMRINVALSELGGPR